MNTKQFNKQKFWDELRVIKREYSIKVSKKPHNRSAKRITILISTAYLAYEAVSIGCSAWNQHYTGYAKQRNWTATG